VVALQINYIIGVGFESLNPLEFSFFLFPSTTTNGLQVLSNCCQVDAVQPSEGNGRPELTFIVMLAELCSQIKYMKTPRDLVCTVMKTFHTFLPIHARFRV
jgi:hypothetical protein